MTNMWLKVGGELSNICHNLLSLLDSHLIPSTASPKSRVFYSKMKGDYCHYLVEFRTGAKCKEAAENTLLAYKAAQVPSPFCTPYYSLRSSTWHFCQACALVKGLSLI
ncbi:hypothetical protein L7F22_057340 [Adiantum nelumboides]|nr:hypothetical protein [Adiantum nelumboides]